MQVLQEVLDEFRGVKCYVTEKLDGSSVTYYVKNGTFSACSRNLELYETVENSIWRVAREMDLETKLQWLGGDFALQGEIVGSSIQGNKYKLKNQTVYFFNVFDIANCKHLDYADFVGVMERLQLPRVPVLDADYSLSNDIPELVRMASAVAVERRFAARRDRHSAADGKDDDHRASGRVSFKAINPEFLVKFE